METTKIIKATLKYLYKGVSKFDKTKTKKFILQIASDALNELTEDNEVKNCYKGSKMLPAWFKGKNDKINLSSLYNIPIEYDGARYDTDDFIADFEQYIKESEVTIKLRFKDGACYPQAIRFDKLGEKQDIFNPFEDFDADDALPFE